MPRQQYAVRIPTMFFDACQETREDQFWIDDRGFVYAVAWSEECQKPLAACLCVPDGEHPSDAWHRDTPQPEVMEH